MKNEKTILMKKTKKKIMTKRMIAKKIIMNEMKLLLQRNSKKK
jgi:hypothetical protein